MIKQILLIVLMLSALTTFSQQRTSGKIIFKETIKFKMEIAGNNSEMAKMLPSSQSVDKVLYYKNGESIYINHEKPKDTELTHEDGGNKFQIVIKVPETITYIDSEKDELLQFQDIMGKEFLITDKPVKFEWKVSGEQKRILDYVCQKAMLTDTSKNIVAWFAPQLPISSGPGGYNGLPGMILCIEQDGGERTTIASALEAFPDNYIFVKPTKGKKVTKKEFDKIREEKMKEMGVINGKGTGVKMIIREEKH